MSTSWQPMPADARPAVEPIDPTSSRGKQVAHDLAVISAGVINRMRAEGKPLPPPP